MIREKGVLIWLINLVSWMFKTNLLSIFSILYFYNLNGQGVAEIMQFPDKIPIWKTCDSLKNMEKDNCTNKEIFLWISTRLVTPKGIDFSDYSGTNILVQFIVSEAGKVNEVKILKGVHPKLDSQVVEIIQKMPDFIPAQINGRKSEYSFNLPIRVELE